MNYMKLRLRYNNILWANFQIICQHNKSDDGKVLISNIEIASFVKSVHNTT